MCFESFACPSKCPALYITASAPGCRGGGGEEFYRSRQELLSYLQAAGAIHYELLEAQN